MITDDVKKFITDNWNNVVRYNPCDKDTLIGLPFPYTVPCISDTFQELYYWDTYFTNIGLLLSDKTEIAKNNVDNMIYLINKFGFMLNGSRTYYLFRSQPPFLSLMVRDIFEKTKDKDWLFACYTALKKDYDFWQNKRITPSGLNRYYGNLNKFSENAEHLCNRIKILLPNDEQEREKLGQSFYAGAESGWDFSSRFMPYAQNINPVCLNSLLFMLESNMAYFSDILSVNESKFWLDKMSSRKANIDKTMWDENVGRYCDYNFAENIKSHLVSTAMFYPLFAKIANREQAESTVKLLSKLEYDFGVASCENSQDILNLQWDFPNGWACQQYIVIVGLLNYGYKKDAVRLAEKYINVVNKNYKITNKLWEKYNVVTGDVSVTSEYETPPMLGWSAGVYLYCIKLIEEL
ncbi:MAG: alpha,alpha-trehalase [Clostridia bacterium]|nr:alpha,alpha-trehalase [Clostridia bacterium]